MANYASFDADPLRVAPLGGRRTVGAGSGVENSPACFLGRNTKDEREECLGWRRVRLFNLEYRADSHKQGRFQYFNALFTRMEKDFLNRDHERKKRPLGRRMS